MIKRTKKPVVTADAKTSESDARATHEQIAALAKALWEARGRPEGSPEKDWFEAEKKLKAGA